MELIKAIDRQQLYLDANIFIYALEAVKPWMEISQQLFSAIDKGQCCAATSELTLAECLVKPFELKNENAIKIYLDFLQNRRFLTIIPTNREIMLESAKIRANNPGIKLPDAIHAATALHNKCTLFLTNDRRFQTIANIKAILFFGIKIA